MLCLLGEREYPSLFGLCSGRLDLEKHRSGQSSVAGAWEGLHHHQGLGPVWAGEAASRRGICQGPGLRPQASRTTVWMNGGKVPPSQRSYNLSIKRCTVACFLAKETEEKRGLWHVQVVEQAMVGSWSRAFGSWCLALVVPGLCSPCQFPSSPSFSF